MDSTPMYIIKKKVHKCTYWWNEKRKRWEGLLDNATALGEEVFNMRYSKLESQPGVSFDIC